MSYEWGIDVRSPMEQFIVLEGELWVMSYMGIYRSSYDWLVTLSEGDIA
jgi:hypothetical protein